MGRTLPSIMMLIESERAHWSAFRRGLRREDQLIFDRLWSAARHHAAAAAYVANAIPFETFLFSMLIEQEKRIQKIEEKEKAPQR